MKIKIIAFIISYNNNQSKEIPGNDKGKTIPIKKDKDKDKEKRELL